MYRRLTAAAAAALALAATPLAAQTTINFDNLAANSNLGTQLGASTGAIFSSNASFVRVVSLGVNHATSAPNGIAGATAGGGTCFGCPIFIRFVNPADNAQNATTTFVRIKGDLITGTATATMRAFDVDGTQLGQVSFTEPPAGQLFLQNIGAIHRVEITQTAANIAFDDLEFGPLTVIAPPPPPGTVVPEPSTYALLATGLVGLALAARRRTRR